MIETAVDHATEAKPIVILDKPTTRDEAIWNLFAFSDEGRRKPLPRDDPKHISVTSIPQIRKCHGWLKISGQRLQDLGPELAPPRLVLDGIVREIKPPYGYFGIVYEYIDSGKNDTCVVQEGMDFFWRTGFAFARTLKEKNWERGVLVDMSEIICPWQLGWTNRFGRQDADRLQ